MARTGITYEEVELAAETILQFGEEPTIEKIRLTTGTGSNTTISKYLKEWRSVRLKAMPDVLPTLHTPPDPVNRAVSQVWQELKDQSDQALAEYKAAKETEITELTQSYETQLAALTGALAEKTSTLEELQQAHEHKKRDVLSLDLQLQDAKQSIAVKDETIHRLQIQLEQLQLEQQRLETVTHEANQRHQQQLENMKTESLSASNRLEASYQNQLSEQKASSESMRHQLIADIDSWKTKCQQLEGQLSDEKLRNSHLEKELASYQQKLSITNDIVQIVESLAKQRQNDTAKQTMQLEQKLLPIQQSQVQQQEQLVDISKKLHSLVEFNVQTDND